MATIGHWNKQGIMFEEFLFWDNGEFWSEPLKLDRWGELN
jgi:hypothetical protein